MIQEAAAQNPTVGTTFWKRIISCRRQAALRPHVPLLEPEQVVEASLAALASGEVICLPAPGDPTLVEREREARNALLRGNMSGALAERHRRGPIP